jgi:oligopeptide/dipeptide ABC transporter ATP-binding protein
MTHPLLEVRHLHVAIPTPRGVVHAVDDVSFTVEPGEVVALVGESGCGKSTTLKAVLGLLPRRARIEQGQILFESADLATLSQRRLREVRGRSIGMVFQDPMTALNPILRVGDQIAEALRWRLKYSGRRARERAIELMEEVGIPDPERRYRAYPHELSGGMRQRVMIAVALSCEPRLILCDEPTTALDVTIQDQILKLLLAQCQRIGASIVYVTHDLAVVAQTCTRLAVMYAGQIVETGTVADVCRQPRHPYTLGLLESVPDFDELQTSLKSIPGRPPDLAAPPAGCRFHPRCPYAQPNCATGVVPLFDLGPGRQTACLYHERLLAAPSPLGVSAHG